MFAQEAGASGDEVDEARLVVGHAAALRGVIEPAVADARLSGGPRSVNAARQRGRRALLYAPSSHVAP